MSDPFLGQIMMGGWNFAPRGWALCNGQLLAIAQNSALFALLGTNYGGNGTTTFGLPDLRGRVPMHWGQGPGLTPRNQGEIGGAESVTLIGTQIPAHTHPILGADEATTKSPANAVPGFTGAPAYNATSNLTMQPTGASSGGQPHDNIQPFVTITFVIALQGIFPSRN